MIVELCATNGCKLSGSCAKKQEPESATNVRVSKFYPSEIRGKTYCTGYQKHYGPKVNGHTQFAYR